MTRAEPGPAKGAGKTELRTIPGRKRKISLDHRDVVVPEQGGVSGSEELVNHPQELLGLGKDERVVRAVDNDELRTSDAVVEHLRVVDRHPSIVRGSSDER